MAILSRLSKMVIFPGAVIGAMDFVQACFHQLPKSSNLTVAALALRPVSGYPENKRRTFLESRPAQN
jgi:hypothetical protein